MHVAGGRRQLTRPPSRAGRPSRSSRRASASARFAGRGVPGRRTDWTVSGVVLATWCRRLWEHRGSKAHGRVSARPTTGEHIVAAVLRLDFAQASVGLTLSGQKKNLARLHDWLI